MWFICVFCVDVDDFYAISICCDRMYEAFMYV
jgi:hypothetical protein